MAKERVIWSSEINVKDWIGDREDIMENSKDAAECEDCRKKDCAGCGYFLDEITRINDYYLDDEMHNLSKTLPNRLVAFADLGLWNGRQNGFRILGNNLNNIFNIHEDYNKYYVDGYNVKAECTHHDGTNYITYRMLKPDVDVGRFEDIMIKNDYKLSPQQISHYTVSIRPFVAKIYGW